MTWCEFMCPFVRCMVHVRAQVRAMCMNMLTYVPGRTSKQAWGVVLPLFLPQSSRAWSSTCKAYNIRRILARTKSPTITSNTSNTIIHHANTIIKRTCNNTIPSIHHYPLFDTLVVSALMQLTGWTCNNKSSQPSTDNIDINIIHTLEGPITNVVFTPLLHLSVWSVFARTGLFKLRFLK